MKLRNKQRKADVILCGYPLLVYPPYAGASTYKIFKLD